MADDLSYYGRFTAEELFEGACQYFEVGCFALEHGDREMFRQCDAEQKKFAAAHRLMLEREKQTYLH